MVTDPALLDLVPLHAAPYSCGWAKQQGQITYRRPAVCAAPAAAAVPSLLCVSRFGGRTLQQNTPPERRVAGAGGNRTAPKTRSLHELSQFFARHAKKRQAILAMIQDAFQRRRQERINDPAQLLAPT